MKQEKINEIENLLKTGRARISGRTTKKHLLGEGFWVIEIYNESTIHVPISERPGWEDFEKKQ